LPLNCFGHQRWGERSWEVEGGSFLLSSTVHHPTSLLPRTYKLLLDKIMTEEVSEPSTLCVCSAEMKESSSGGFDFDLEELTFLLPRFPSLSLSSQVYGNPRRKPAPTLYLAVLFILGGAVLMVSSSWLQRKESFNHRSSFNFD